MQDWKPIDGYEGLYEVSPHGAVRSCKRITVDGKHLSTKILNGGCYPNGYEFVCLRKNGHNRNRMTHRLVAEAFIQNPHKLPCVNHMDGNKHNNDVANLEWCTHSENRRHAYITGLSPQRGLPRKVTVKHGEHIIMFDTMTDCSRFFGFKKTWLNGQIRKHGCTFSYKGYEIQVHERV